MHPRQRCDLYVSAYLAGCVVGLPPTRCFSFDDHQFADVSAFSFADIVGLHGVHSETAQELGWKVWWEGKPYPGMSTGWAGAVELGGVGTRLSAGVLYCMCAWVSSHVRTARTQLPRAAPAAISPAVRRPPASAPGRQRLPTHRGTRSASSVMPLASRDLGEVRCGQYEQCRRAGALAGRIGDAPGESSWGCQPAIAKIHYSHGPLWPKSIIAKVRVRVRRGELFHPSPLSNGKATPVSRIHIIVAKTVGVRAHGCKQRCQPDIAKVRYSQTLPKYIIANVRVSVSVNVRVSVWL